MLLVLAILVGVVSWWVTGHLAKRGLLAYSLDHPNERSLHAVPVPRTGGVAIIASLLFGVLVAAIGTLWGQPDSMGGMANRTEGLWILGATVFLSLVSFLDDRKGLPVGVRFSLQIMAACCVMFGAQLQLGTVTVPALGTIALGWVSIPFTLLFILWMTNLYNFMDGMDGFAGGMTVFGYGLLGFLAWQAHQPVFALLAVMHSAAAAGFLVHNFPPARIFMGDVGSVSTGFLAASLIVLGCREGVFDLWVPVIVFSPFILDATLTLARRMFLQQKVWEAHRDHYYQRLVLRGWGHRRTVLTEYGVMALCGMLALSYEGASDGWRLAILTFWGVVFLLLATWVDGMKPRWGQVRT